MRWQQILVLTSGSNLVGLGIGVDSIGMSAAGALFMALAVGAAVVDRMAKRRSRGTR